MIIETRRRPSARPIPKHYGSPRLRAKRDAKAIAAPGEYQPSRDEQRAMWAISRARETLRRQEGLFTTAPIDAIALLNLAEWLEDADGRHRLIELHDKAMF